MVLLCTCCNQKSNEQLYRAEIEKIIEQAQVPLIQLEYHSPQENISLQVENPRFYDSVKIDAGTATPHPAVFQAASLSKVVFAYIVMKMYDNGEIDLDTPLYQYTNIDRFKILPNQNDDKKPLRLKGRKAKQAEKAALELQIARAQKLTARMILNHRSGLPNWSAGPSSAQWPTSPIAFKFAPDSCFGYSGEGFAFLQRAVETIRGKGIEEIAREEVFEPLQMQLTSYTWLPQYDTLAVDGYNGKGENRGVGKHPRANVGYTLRTCAADYSKFLQALLHGTGLKPETAAMMFEANTGNAVRYADHHRECDSTIAWAMGIGTENNFKHGKVLWHWGDNGNFKALFMIIPKEDITLAYFTNSNYGHDIIDPLTALLLKDHTPFTLSDWISHE